MTGPADIRLKAREDRLQLALDGARMGMWEWDLATNRVRCNEYHCRIWGFPPGTLEMSVEELGKRIHPDDLERVRKVSEEATRIRGDFDAIYRIRWPDGSVHWLHGRGRTYYDAADKPAYMLGTVMDITAQRQAERDASTAHAELQSQVNQFRMLVEAIPQLVWTTTADGLADYFNRNWVAYTGLTHDESVGYGWKNAIHPDDWEALLSKWKRALELGEPYEAEFRLRNAAEGKYRWTLTRALPLRDANGRVVKWFGTCTDIQLQKRQAEELERSNAELERFAYVASHDLKEPLRMISIYVQLLQDRYRGKLDADADEFIRYAYDGAAQMRALIDDLLAFSRVARDEPRAVTVDLNAILANVVTLLKPAIEESHAQVSVEMLPVVSGDPIQFTQLFQNVLGNALKFRGEQAPRITVSATKDGSEWHFRVTDNGIGIDPKYFDRIFGLFQRLHTRAEYPGTGIGLAICKKIVERHGGRIWVESAPEKGATFHFTLRG